MSYVPMSTKRGLPTCADILSNNEAVGPKDSNTSIVSIVLSPPTPTTTEKRMSRRERLFQTLSIRRQFHNERLNPRAFTPPKQRQPIPQFEEPGEPRTPCSVSFTETIQQSSFDQYDSEDPDKQETLTLRSPARSLINSMRKMTRSTAATLRRASYATLRSSNASHMTVSTIPRTPSLLSQEASSLSYSISSIRSKLSFMTLSGLRRPRSHASLLGSTSEIIEFPSQAYRIQQLSEDASTSKDRLLYFSYMPSFYPLDIIQAGSGAPDSINLFQPPAMHRPNSPVFVGVGNLMHYEIFTDAGEFTGLAYKWKALLPGNLYLISEGQLMGLTAWDKILYPNFAKEQEYRSKNGLWTTKDVESSIPKYANSTSIAFGDGQLSMEDHGFRHEHKLARIKVRVDGPGRMTGLVSCVTWA